MRTGEKTSRLIFFWEVDETHTCPNKNYWTYTIDYSYIIDHSHQLFVTVFQVYGFLNKICTEKETYLGHISMLLLLLLLQWKRKHERYKHGHPLYAPKSKYQLYEL